MFICSDEHLLQRQPMLNRRKMPQVRKKKKEMIMQFESKERNRSDQDPFDTNPETKKEILFLSQKRRVSHRVIYFPLKLFTPTCISMQTAY
ncbi:hypothetical protein CEXT_686951 [Caerostris extrusa]|uniref:Ycf1 n=1 Tax=Caerostris extrusa TaxID=172846 RepID=A0AAV4M7Z0_CAEEX|nr:hypothetical protein CEXT_686951 [Caerostris extrusa]